MGRNRLVDGGVGIGTQRLFDDAADNGNIRDYLYDALHPNIAGARLIANEWMKLYNNKIKNI